MAFSHYVRSGQTYLRCGYTTGTCAALAAMGAAQLLLTGTAPDMLSLRTPKGWTVETEPRWCRREGDGVSCAVEKDAGDDPDVTDGCLIAATVRKTESGLTIDGGAGVGRVTKPGLDQPVGAAAINRVPRQMIAAAVDAVRTAARYTGGLSVVISVPDGERLAAKTFNPHLGIAGGISILGTTGVVEPMSQQAMVDALAVEIRQAAATGDRLILTPGNYGLDFLRRTGLDALGVPVVRCSNFIGDALDSAAAEGMRTVLLAGHMGKLVKLAGGIMNTHSRQADCRGELFCAHAAVCGADTALCRALLDAPTTDACLALLDGVGLRDPVLHSLLNAIQRHLDRRTAGVTTAGAVVFSNEYGYLGKTSRAGEILSDWIGGTGVSLEFFTNGNR